MRSRFYYFASDVNQQNEGVRYVQDFVVWPQGWEDFPWILCKLLKT